jgi:hypothetical protein
MMTAHEQAFTYDWRNRFGLPLTVVFDGTMSWGETWALTAELAADPSSRVGAAVAGWSHPLDRGAIVTMDLYDLTLRSLSGRREPKPYPRPWDPKPVVLGRPSVSQAAVRAALAARGHG